MKKILLGLSVIAASMFALPNAAHARNLDLRLPADVGLWCGNLWPSSTCYFYQHTSTVEFGYDGTPTLKIGQGLVLNDDIIPSLKKLFADAQSAAAQKNARSAQNVCIGIDKDAIAELNANRETLSRADAKDFQWRHFRNLITETPCSVSRPVAQREPSVSMIQNVIIQVGAREENRADKPAAFSSHLTETKKSEFLEPEFSNPEHFARFAGSMQDETPAQQR
jgi:hypothetical protein